MARIIKLKTRNQSIHLEQDRLKCDTETIINKMANFTVNDILVEIISKYIKKGLPLAEILYLEAPTNKNLQIEITKIYGEYILTNLQDIPINQNTIESSQCDILDQESIIENSSDESIELEQNIQLNSEQEEFRDTIQLKYISSCIEILDSSSSKRVLLKAPTGFGKTVILYKIMDKLACNINVILTPRRQLNIQSIEHKYHHHLTKPEDWTFHNFSPDSNITAYSKKHSLTKFITASKSNNKKMIILACYQESSAKLLDYFTTAGITIDLCICDEAHTIANWGYLENERQRVFLGASIDSSDGSGSSNRINRYIFATATPSNDMITRPEIWGRLVEHVQIYELINKGLLCPFEVLIKSCSHKNKIIDVAKIVMKTMNKYNKRKGIVYCNNITNALIVYANFKLKYPDANIFIYVSDRHISQKTFDNFLEYPEFKNVIWNPSNASISEFNKCKKPAIVITVRMLGYGYDNVNIDLLAFADARDGEAEIRQILGRGLRNDLTRKIYPDKLLHVIIPITKKELLDENNDVSRLRRQCEYKNLKRFLEFIVTECGKDIINGRIISRLEGHVVPEDEPINGITSNSGDESRKDEEDTTSKKKKKTNKYDGDEIPLEICRELSTNLYGTYTRFLGFLRQKHVFDEASYNQMREDEGSPDWIPVLGEVRKKFKKFCFLDIKSPENSEYYQTWEECYEAYDTCIKMISQEYGSVARLKKKKTESQINKKILEMDARIPSNMDLFYYNSN